MCLHQIDERVILVTCYDACDHDEVQYVFNDLVWQLNIGYSLRIKLKPVGRMYAEKSAHLIYPYNTFANQA